MATGFCNNDECEKDKWELTKHPSQYSRGVTCPECGTSDTDHAAREQAQQTQPAAQTADATPAPQQGQQPATQEQQGNAPLPTSEEAVGIGMEAGKLISGLSSEDPTEKAAATGRTMKTIGATLAQLGDHQEQQARERNQRAKDASQDQIQVNEDYIHCPECDTPLTNIPAGEFTCPSCSTPLKYEE